ncbi:conjugal transfer protein TraF [Nitrospira moscoviensis]|nr:conjugal transfer protein TraF [Nitrospira moscoviensis]
MAVEFAIVGPRAAGMGGAGVAVTTDALATYWNPAGLAMTQAVDIRAVVTGQAIDRGDVRETLKDIENFRTPDPTRAQELADRINRGTVSGIAAGGLYAKGHFGEHAFGFNVSDVATAGAFVDPSNQFRQTGGSVQGAFLLRGLEARQAAFSYAYAFADKTFAIGVTGKIIQGAAYAGSVGVSGGQDVNLTDNFGKAKISTTYGVDVGAIYQPSSWLRVAVVAKDLNQPEFDAPDGSQYKLNPQVRGGVAVKPWSTLTLAADVDVTSNKTFVPGVKSQVIGLGAEQTILSEFLSFRVGAFKNMQDAASPFTPTAGFGIRIFALRVDVGGGYDFRERGALASGSVSLTF